MDHESTDWLIQWKPWIAQLEMQSISPLSFISLPIEQYVEIELDIK